VRPCHTQRSSDRVARVRSRRSLAVHGLIPIADSEPVSIARPEPPVAAGQGSRSQTRTTHAARHGVECAELHRSRDVAWRHVTDRFRGTDEADEGCRRGLGHSRVVRRRLGRCWKLWPDADCGAGLHTRCAIRYRSRTLEPTLSAERCFLSACSPKARDGSGYRVFIDSLAPMCGLGAIESMLARVGPTPCRGERNAVLASFCAESQRVPATAAGTAIHDPATSNA
jgi:hypothetical protein